MITVPFQKRLLEQQVFVFANLDSFSSSNVPSQRVEVLGEKLFFNILVYCQSFSKCTNCFFNSEDLRKATLMFMKIYKAIYHQKNWAFLRKIIFFIDNVGENIQCAHFPHIIYHPRVTTSS